MLIQMLSEACGIPYSFMPLCAPILSFLPFKCTFYFFLHLYLCCLEDKKNKEEVLQGCNDTLFLLFFQLVKVREKVKDVPALLAKFDELNKKLHINGQVTTYTLDALLCHTPSDRQPHTVLLNKRTVSRRTFQPLSQSLWAE